MSIWGGEAIPFGGVVVTKRYEYHRGQTPSLMLFPTMRDLACINLRIICLRIPYHTRIICGGIIIGGCRAIVDLVNTSAGSVEIAQHPLVYVLQVGFRHQPSANAALIGSEYTDRTFVPVSSWPQAHRRKVRQLYT